MITLREGIALILLIIFLVLYSNVEAGESSYTWIYGGYTYTPKEYNDKYLMQYGEEWATLMGGYTTCTEITRTTSLCAKVYYQHSSHYNYDKDIGWNSVNGGFELRWY